MATVKNIEKIITKAGYIGFIVLNGVKDIPASIQAIDMEMQWYSGYVLVQENNKYHGKEYCDVDIDVHGGLTFSCAAEKCQLTAQEKLSGTVFGFDCAHCYDTIAKCNKEYVIAEIEKLAEQLKLGE